MTVRTTLPPEISEMLHRIDTFEKLELVMMLFEADNRTLTMRALDELLRCDVFLKKQTIDSLLASNIIDVRHDDEVHVQLVIDHHQIAALHELYHRDREPIARTLSEIAIARIREHAARITRQ